MKGEVHMEQTELQKLYEEIESLKERITTLESIINGCQPKRAGRNPKLSLEQQAEIVQKHNLGMSYSVLAKEYKVCKGTISKICHGKPNLPAPEKAKVFTPIRRKDYVK